ncbi:hypothetical protein HAX54_026586 [Datura stramonium]|uniref:Uncharacterized protein n=1 Tax=Datura stramonium TaxID=4076 RepID=A0ABS8V493_DATST|nr:hypothetical protein [Datura stramonium]
MAPKPSKGKGEDSSYHESKRSKRASEGPVMMRKKLFDYKLDMTQWELMTKPKELEGVHGPVLYVNERNAQINNMLSHFKNGWSEARKRLNIDYPAREHSRALCRVGPGFEEPLDDDVATEDEMAKVDFDIESSDAKEDCEIEDLLFPRHEIRGTGVLLSFFTLCFVV